MTESGPDTEVHGRLSDFLRDHREEIMAEWESRVRSVRAARNLERPLLLDHMPQFLDDLADYVAEARAGANAPPRDEYPRIHALERLELGYDLAEVVDEYAILRRCITDLALHSSAPSIRSQELPRLHQAVDQAISTSVVRYTEARDRTLRALDRISSAALIHDDVEELLPATLDAFLETTASVDSVALALRDDPGSLRIRSAVGFPQPVVAGLELESDSFAGRIAQTARPLFLGDCSSDAAIARGPLCAPGTHALYGVPLMFGQKVAGVAVMGSRSSYEFSQEDQFLFRTMVARTAALLGQARLHAEVQRRAQELSLEVETRDRIFGVLSHDLRNPLSVILTSSELAQRAKSEEHRVRALQRISGNVRRIERMVHDLLDYSRARHGSGIPVVRTETDLQALCAQVIEGAQVLNPDRPLRLTTEGKTIARLDADRCLQVISNLVANAMRYGSPGTPVDVRVRDAGDAVELSVHNEGPPITPEILPRIFEAFQRAAPDESGPGAGLGLGLYIVKQIVTAHGGSITVRSDESGTAFTARFPR